MSQTRLARALSAIGRPRVLVVGDLMLDRYVFGHVDRISPEAPIPVLRVEREEHRPGGAGSVATMLTALEAEVCFVAAIGDDEAGRALQAELERLGIGTDGLVTLPGRPTTRKTRHIADVQHLLRVDDEVTSALDDATAKEIAARACDRVAACDVVLVSDYGKGLVDRRLLAKIMGAAGEHGKEVILDPKKQPDWSAYRGVTAITPNRAETQLASGIAPSSPASWQEAAQTLARDLDLARVVLTLDREGIYLFDAREGRHAHIPTEARAVYDVTGAGDMVLSVTGLCRAAGVAWPDAVALANAAAGLEIQRVGVAAIRRDEIRAALTGHDDPIAQKITTLEAFCEETLPELRRQKKRLVYTNGCYDILHIGHIRLLQFARAQGDHLVVGLNSDASIRRLKGAGRPFLQETDRAQVLAALGDVDHVILFDEDTPIAHIDRLVPAVLVKAADYDAPGRTVVGRAVVEGAGGHIAFGPLVGGVSTTHIVKKIRENAGRGEAEGAAARLAADAAYAAVEAAAKRREDDPTSGAVAGG